MTFPLGSAPPAALAWAILVCVVTGTVAPVGAASIMVHGPAGAAITIDGTAYGTLPLAEPIVLQQGTHVLRCTRAGYRTHVESFSLDDRDHDLTLTVDMLEFSRWKATGLSLVWAGLGQHYQNRRTAGWTMMAVQAVAAGFAIYGEIEFKDQRDTFEEAMDTYERSVDRQVIAEQKARALQAYDDMETAETIRNVALWTVLGTAVVSAVDAWLAHDGLVVRTGDLEMGALPMDQPLQVGWRVRF